MNRKSQLVSQHLENVSREALGKYQDIVRRYIRGREGVYALYRKRRLYYVGLASNLRSRLKDHLRDRHKESWDHFSVYLTIGAAHLRELESLIQRVARPSGNHQIGRFVKAENLRKRFAREVRLMHLAEARAVFGEEVEVGGRRSRTRSAAATDSGRTPPLAAYPDKPAVLRARFKGKLLRAKVCKNGTIRFAKKTYRSPSVAAAAACGRKTCNGWTFWTYERAPGDWVLLDELRRR